MNSDRLRELTQKNVLVKTLLYPAIVARRSFLKGKRSREREVLAKLCEMLVGDPVIKFDEFCGEFAMDPHSDLFARIVINQHYEPQLVKLCLKHLDADRDVIDVGANIGLYTVLFAKNLPRTKVLSIEPATNALRRLHRNIELNGVVSSVDVFEGVASNKRGMVEIKTVKGKEEYSSLGAMKHPGIANEEWVTEDVRSARLDDLVEERSLNPGFMKVDVEGCEHMVLEGAQNILSSKRPFILMELSDFLLKQNGSSANEVMDLLKGYEYDVADPFNPSTHPKAKDFGEIFCIPRETKSRIDA